MSVGNPVRMGLVANLARPGGNLTGFSNLIGELVSKRLDLVPRAGVKCPAGEPNQPLAQDLLGNAQEAARAKGMEFRILKAGTESKIDAAFASFVELCADALVVAGHAFFANRREQLWRWHHAIPCRRSMGGPTSRPPAV